MYCNCVLIYVEKIDSTYMNLLIYCILCILIIYLGHYIWNYLLDKYTIKKVKTNDKQTEKYKHMFDEYQENKNKPDDYLSNEEKIDMIYELNKFMDTFT